LEARVTTPLSPAPSSGAARTSSASYSSEAQTRMLSLAFPGRPWSPRRAGVWPSWSFWWTVAGRLSMVLMVGTGTTAYCGVVWGDGDRALLAG
jgi:hypothetical protein